MGFVSDLITGGNEPDDVRAPDILAQENLLTQITPTGTLRVGSIGRDGEFTPAERLAATRIEETPFQEQFRTGREELTLGLLGQLQGFQFPELGSPTVTPRSADAIRAILPSAQGTARGLPSVRSASSIQGGLSPFVQAGDFGSEIERLEDATFEGVRRRLDPTFREREERLRQSLADRGIPVTSRAGERELQRLTEAEDEALTRAGLQAVQAGRGEQERLARLGLATRGQQLGEGLSLAGLEGQTRGQLFGERRAQLQDALQKQLALAELERAQRAQQLQERQLQNQERLNRFGEIGSLFGFDTPFSGSIVNTGAGTQTQNLKTGLRQGRASAIGDLAGVAGTAAGGFGGFGNALGNLSGFQFGLGGFGGIPFGGF